MFGSAVIDMERGQFNEPKPNLWQSCTSVARNSWGYTEDNDYKTANEIICDLVDIVSKNGCLLLNIGPKGDGSIPEEDKKLLLEIGDWLKSTARPFTTLRFGGTHQKVQPKYQKDNFQIQRAKSSLLRILDTP